MHPTCWRAFRSRQRAERRSTTPGAEKRATGKIHAANGASTGKKKGAEERRRRNAVVDGLLSDRKAAQDSEGATKKGGKK